MIDPGSHRLRCLQNIFPHSIDSHSGCLGQPEVLPPRSNVEWNFESWVLRRSRESSREASHRQSVDRGLEVHSYEFMNKADWRGVGSF